MTQLSSLKEVDEPAATTWRDVLLSISFCIPVNFATLMMAWHPYETVSYSPVLITLIFILSWPFFPLFLNFFAISLFASWVGIRPESRAYLIAGLGSVLSMSCYFLFGLWRVYLEFYLYLLG